MHMHSGTEWERTTVGERDTTRYFFLLRQRAKKSHTKSHSHTYVDICILTLNQFLICYMFYREIKERKFWWIFRMDFFKLKLFTFYPIVVNFALCCNNIHDFNQFKRKKLIFLYGVNSHINFFLQYKRSLYSKQKECVCCQIEQVWRFLNKSDHTECVQWHVS